MVGFSPRTKVMTGAALVMSGFASVVMAAPANAVENTPLDWLPCDTVADQGVNESPDWLINGCVPQYGLGKAEFTIASDVDLPEGFSLENATVSYGESVDQGAVESYFGLPPGGDIPMALFVDILNTLNVLPSPLLIPETSTPQFQQYVASYPVPVTELVALAPENITMPSDIGFAEFCEPYVDSAQVLQVSFAPVTVAFTQTIEGVTWTVPVSVSPTPLTIAFLGENGFCVWNGSLWQDAAGNSGTGFSGLGVLMLPINIVGLNPHPFATSFFSDDPFSSPDGFLGFANLGSIPVQRTGSLAPAPAELAVTGRDNGNVLTLAGAGLLALGAGALLLRRKSARRPFISR